MGISQDIEAHSRGNAQALYAAKVLRHYETKLAAAEKIVANRLVVDGFMLDTVTEGLAGTVVFRHFSKYLEGIMKNGPTSGLYMGLIIELSDQAALSNKDDAGEKIIALVCANASHYLNSSCL